MDDHINRINRDQDNEQSAGEFMAGALFGAVAGGIAALLLTPKNGEEMRSMAQDYLKDWDKDARHFSEDVKEAAEVFRQALEEQAGQAWQQEEKLRHQTTQRVGGAARQAGQGYQAMRESVSEVVEAVRSGWNEYDRERRADMYPAMSHESPASMVKMGSAAAVAEPEPMVEAKVEAPASVDIPETQTQPEMEEPAFAREARKTGVDPREAVADEPVEEVAEMKSSRAETIEPVVEPEAPALADPMDQAARAWSAPTHQRRRSSAYTFGLHTQESEQATMEDPGFDAPEAEAEPTVKSAVEEVTREVRPLTANLELDSYQTSAAPEYEPAPSTPEVANQPMIASHDEESEVEPEPKSSTRAPKRDASGRKTLYTTRVIEASRAPTEPVPVEPITSEKPKKGVTRPKKNLFFKKK